MPAYGPYQSRLGSGLPSALPVKVSLSLLDSTPQVSLRALITLRLALLPLSYGPEDCGGPGWVRTNDLLLVRQAFSH